MKSPSSLQKAEKKPRTPLAKQSKEFASQVTPQAHTSFDDLHAHITVRAYELYVERGRRDGCALEDWLDTEREILSRQPAV